MAHHRLGGQEGRGEVVVAAEGQDPQVRIGGQGMDQIGAGVGHGEREGEVGDVVPEVPEDRDPVAQDGVGAALSEFQIGMEIVEERRRERRSDGRGEWIVVRVLAQRVEAGAGEAGVEDAEGQVLAPQQLLGELARSDPQLRLLHVVGGETGVLMDLLGDRVALRGGERVSLQQRRGVVSEREGAHLGEEGLERVGPPRQGVVVPGRRGEARQGQRIGFVVAGERVDRLEVDPHRKQDDAVERHVGVRLEIVDHARRARGAVALAEQILGRAPAVVVVDVPHDEAADRFDVRIDSPEILVLAFANRMAESGADGIDQHQIGLVEDAVNVVDHLVGCRRRRAGVGGDDAARPERSHVQPERRRAGTAVVGESDRPPAGLAGIASGALDVGDIADRRRRLVLLVAHQQRARGGGVGDRSAADREAVLGGDRRLGSRRRAGRPVLRADGTSRGQGEERGGGRQPEEMSVHARSLERRL